MDTDIVQNNSSLLDVFKTEYDQSGADLLAMSDFFEILIEKTREKIKQNSDFETVTNIKTISSNISSAIKCGIDVSNMGTLVADSSHFNKDIVEGLKSGKYRIGESKTVSGNYIPAVVDESGKIVKQFTLKKSLNPSELLSDYQLMSIQTSLNQISSDIQLISEKLDYSINFNRRRNLSDPFINARSFLKLALNNPEKQEDYLIKADDQLTIGLNALYSDFSSIVDELAKQKFFKAKKNNIDRLLTFINEDLLMVPKYVGLKLYLYNYSGRKSDLKDTIDDFLYNIKLMNDKTNYNEKYTVAQLIHEYYPYDETNIDFWIAMPNNTVSVLKDYTKYISEEESDLIYLDEYMEES